MELSILAGILRDSYNNATGNKVAMIHIFGIKYHEEIKEHGAKAVVEKSGLSSKYYTEVRKGMNLSGFVDLKERYM